MEQKGSIIFKIEGAAQKDHHLDLSVLVNKIQQFHKLLNSVSEQRGKFQVVNISHSSPMALECVPTTPGDFAAAKILMHNMYAVKSGDCDKLSNRDLSAMETVAKLNSEEIKWAEIQFSLPDSDLHPIYQLDDDFRNHLLSARRKEDRDISTVDGRLEEINIHDNNTFKIYRTLSSMPTVTCKFSDNLLDDAKNALGRFVSACGECFYRPAENFPYKMKVRELQVLPPTEELPTLMGLRGIAPGLTGGKSSEQFVRELRDAWEKPNS